MVTWSLAFANQKERQRHVFNRLQRLMTVLQTLTTVLQTVCRINSQKKFCKDVQKKIATSKTACNNNNCLRTCLQPFTNPDETKNSLRSQAFAAQCDTPFTRRCDRVFNPRKPSWQLFSLNYLSRGLSFRLTFLPGMYRGWSILDSVLFAHSCAAVYSKERVERYFLDDFPHYFKPFRIFPFINSTVKSTENWWQDGCDKALWF